MKFDPGIHHRNSIRLHGYDYSQAGGYFVTIVSFGRECLFGEVVDGEMKVNALGRIVQEEWLRSASIRKEIHLIEHEFMVMPNHIHGIVWIDTDFVGADGVRTENEAGKNINDHQSMFHRGTHRVPLQGIGYEPPIRKPKSLGSFIAGFKASVTSRSGRELPSRAGIQPASAVSGSRKPDISDNIWQRNYLSRAFCGAMNTSSATNPITNASPVTSSITQLTGTLTMKIPKTS